MNVLTTHRRWLIVVMLAGFSVVNYVDRQALSVLAPTLRKELVISTEQYSYIVSTFLAAYAIGYAVAGRTLDRFGVKIGLAGALAFWSLVGMGHAAIVGWLSLAAARFLLGLGQSFNTPGGMKALSEWVPQRERGLASALFSNANSLGGVLAPPIVATLALWLGWRWAFVITGASGFILLLVWWHTYERPEVHPSLSEAERAQILKGRSASKVVAFETSDPVSYGAILRNRRCFTLCAIRFITDPFAYFISFWLLDYFQTVRGFSLQTVALLGWIPFLASPLFGGPLGGALSDFLVRRGVEGRVARLRLMFAAACIMPLAMVAVHAEQTWIAIAIVTLLVAANGCWSVNKLTLATELVPRTHVASLISLGGIAGSLGGIVSTLLAGRLIATVGYVPVFTGLGFLHLTAFAILMLGQRKSGDSGTSDLKLWFGQLPPARIHIAESATWACVRARQQQRSPAQIEVADWQRVLVARGVMPASFNDFDMSRSAPWIGALQFFDGGRTWGPNTYVARSQWKTDPSFSHSIWLTEGRDSVATGPIKG